MPKVTCQAQSVIDNPEMTIKEASNQSQTLTEVSERTGTDRIYDEPSLQQQPSSGTDSLEADTDVFDETISSRYRRPTFANGGANEKDGRDVLEVYDIDSEWTTLCG